MMKPFGGPDFKQNESRCGAKWPCAWCGKPIKDNKKAVMVFICCGEFEPAGGEEAHKSHGNNMGGYPLGPDCARRFRAERKMAVVNAR